MVEGLIESKWQNTAETNVQEKFLNARKEWNINNFTWVNGIAGRRGALSY